ncbi:mucin-22 [Penaeus vannamei]|uniref:mucin-22 n=1 Tax=Penaeus vannamei TaxID=6689 RepID=UPI00387F7B95
MAVLRVVPFLLVLLTVCSFPGHVWAHPYPPSVQETPDLLHLTSDSVQQKGSLPESDQLSPDSVHQNSYTILPISVPVQLHLKAVPSPRDPGYLSQGPGLPALNQEAGSIQASENGDRADTDSPGDETGEDVPDYDLNLTSFSGQGLSPNPLPRYARKLANQIPVSTNDQLDKIGDLHVPQITDFRSSKISDQTSPDVGAAKPVRIDAIASPLPSVLPGLGATRLIDLGSAKVIDTKAKSTPDDSKDVSISSIRVTNLGSRPGITYLGSVKASDLGSVKAGDLGLAKTPDAANVQVGDSGFVQESDITSAQVGDLKPNSATDLGSTKTNDLDYIQSSGLESLEARELVPAQTDAFGSAPINELGPTRLIDLGSVKVLDAGPTVDLGLTAGSDLHSAIPSERLTPGIVSIPTKAAETGTPQVSYLGTVKLADLIPTKESDPEIDLENTGRTVLKSAENILDNSQTSTGNRPDFLQPASPAEYDDSFPEIKLDTSPFISLDSALFIDMGPSSTDPSAPSTEVRQDSPLVDLISDTILEMVTKEPDQNSEPGPYDGLFSKPFVILGPGNVQDFSAAPFTSQQNFSEPEDQISREIPFTAVSLHSGLDHNSKAEEGNGPIHNMDVQIDYNSTQSLSRPPIAELGDASKDTSELSSFHDPGNHQTSVHDFAFTSDLQPSRYTPFSDPAYALDPNAGEPPLTAFNSAINTDNEPSSDVAFPSYDVGYNSASSNDFDYPSTLSHGSKQYSASYNLDQLTPLKAEDFSTDSFTSNGYPNPDEALMPQNRENLQQGKPSSTDPTPIHTVSTELNQGTTHLTLPTKSGDAPSQDPTSNTAPRFFREIPHDSGVEPHHSLSSVQGQSVLSDEEQYQVPVLEGEKSSVTGSEYGQLSATGSQYNQLPTTGEKQDHSLPTGLQYDEPPINEATYNISLNTGLDYEQSSVTGSQHNQLPVTGENHSQFSATGSQDNEIPKLMVKVTQPQTPGSEYGLSSAIGSQYSQSLGRDNSFEQAPITGTQYDQSSVTGLENIQTPSTLSQFAHSSTGSQDYQSPNSVSEQQFSLTDSHYDPLSTNVPDPDQSSVVESQYDQSLLTGPQYEQLLPTGPHVQVSATGSIHESPVITSHHFQSLTSGSRNDQTIPILQGQNGQSVNNQFAIADSDFGEPANTGSQNDQFTTTISHHSQHTTSGSQYNQPTINGSQNNQPAITGSQYNQPAITGPQYNQATIGGSQYNQPAITGSQYNQPAITGSQYNQPAITGPQNNQPAITGSQYNQPAITGSQYNQPAITGSQYNQPTAVEESKYNFSDNVNTGYSQQVNGYNPTGIDSAQAVEYDYPTGTGSHIDESGDSRYEYVQASDVHSDYTQPRSTDFDYLQPREEGPSDLQLVDQGTNDVQGISLGNDYVHDTHTGTDYIVGLSDGLDYVQGPGQGSDYVVSDYSQTGPGSIDYVQSADPDISQPLDQGFDHTELTNLGLGQLVDQNGGIVAHTNQISDHNQSGTIAPFIQPVILLPELIHPSEIGSEYGQPSSFDSSAFQLDKTVSDNLTDIKSNVQLDSQAKGKELGLDDIGSDYPHTNPEASQVTPNLGTPNLRTEYSQFNNVRLENVQTSDEETEYDQPLSTNLELTQSRVLSELGHEQDLTNNLGSSQSVDPEYYLQETHLNPQSYENSLPILDLPSTPSKDSSDHTLSGSEFSNNPTQDHGTISSFTNSPDFSLSSSFNSQYEETNDQSPSNPQFSGLDVVADLTGDQHIPLPDQVPIARSIPEANLDNQEYLVQDNFRPTAKFDTSGQNLPENENNAYGLENTSGVEVVPSTTGDGGRQIVHGQGFISAPEFPSGVLDSATTDAGLGIYEHSVSEEISNNLQEENLSQTPVPSTSTLGYTAIPTFGHSQSPLIYTPGLPAEYVADNTATPGFEYNPTPTPGYTPSVRGYTPALAFGYASPITQGYTTPVALGSTPTPAPRLTSLSDYSQSPQPGLGFTPKPVQEYTPSPDAGRGPSPTVGYTPKPITGYTPKPTTTHTAKPITGYTPLEQGRISASTQAYPSVTTQSPTQEPAFTHTTPSVLDRTPLIQNTNPPSPIVGHTPSPYSDVTPTSAPILDNTLAPLQEYTTRTPQRFATAPAYSRAPDPIQGQSLPGFGQARAREQVPGTASPASQRRRKRPSKGRKDPQARPRDQLKPYVFAYSITDPRNGADYGQTEESDGNVVSGQYHVLLPDGRRQMVQYRADPVNGFVSEVEYLDNHLPGSGGFPFPSPRSRVPSPSASPSHPAGGAQYRLPTAGDQYQSPSIQSITRSLPPVELLSQLSTREAAGSPSRTTIEVPSVESSEQKVSAGGDPSQRQEPVAGGPVVRQPPSWIDRSSTGPTWRAYFEN